MKFRGKKLIILVVIILTAFAIIVGAVAYSQRKRVIEYVKEYIGMKIHVTENGIDGINTYEAVYNSRYSERKSVWTFDNNVNTVSLEMYEDETLVFAKTIPNPDHYGVPDSPASGGNPNETAEPWFGYGYRCDTSPESGGTSWDLYNPHPEISPNEKHVNTSSDKYLQNYSLKFAEFVDEMIIAAESLEASLDAETAAIMREMLNSAHFTVSWGVSSEIQALFLARDMTADELMAALEIYSAATGADLYYLNVIEK